jgi:ABC-type sugar transport system ATPase subunit
LTVTAPRLQLHGICKRFGAVEAVQDVSLSIAPSEIRGLCGHNGAGKSTLINIIAGLIPPDEGELQIDGRLVQLQSPRDAQRSGIAWVDQELSLVPTLSIAENIALGSVGARLFRRRHAERTTSSELLAKVGLDHHDPGELLSSLSLGERQLVEIARALGRGAQLLILDEPTATLTDVEIERVFVAIRRVAEGGCAVLFVSHRLGEVLQLCDAVTVMRDGRIVAERPAAELSADALVTAMLGEQLELAPHSRRDETGAIVLSVSDLSVGTQVETFSHEFRAGRVYGLAGQVGAGASEVLRALAGLMPQATGEVALHGRALSLRHPVRVKRQGIGFVTNDRKAEGLFLGRGVGENLTAAQLGLVSQAGMISARLERSRAERLAAAAGVDAARLAQPVALLSGGNQQKALVGRYLQSADITVLLVDEPTRGVDVGGRAVIHRLLREAALSGMAVIFATSDLDELLELAMTVITMRSGHVVGVYPDGVSRQGMLSDLTHRTGADRAETTEALR